MAEEPEVIEPEVVVEPVVEKELVVCKFCEKPVINGEYWAVIRGYNEDANEDGTINLDEHGYGDNFNFKYEEIICKKCLMEGHWMNIQFS